MRFLGRIKGYAKEDKIRNATIRNELNLEPILRTVITMDVNRLQEYCVVINLRDTVVCDSSTKTLVKRSRSSDQSQEGYDDDGYGEWPLHCPL